MLVACLYSSSSDCFNKFYVFFLNKICALCGDRTNAILWDVCWYSEGVTTIIENRSVVRTSNEKSERRSCYQRSVMEEFKRDKLL